MIIEIIKNDKYISRKKIGEMVGYSEKTISKYIQEIGNIRYVGRGKAGHWEIDE
ncbi:HTH domain protein [Peptostreptococcaceae bacterium AS15]|nr:HTH domain protein [Peptostreptococcaceae bacterium AS15]